MTLTPEEKIRRIRYLVVFHAGQVSSLSTADPLHRERTAAIHATAFDSICELVADNQEESGK